MTTAYRLHLAATALLAACGPSSDAADAGAAASSSSTAAAASADVGSSAGSSADSTAASTAVTTADTAATAAETAATSAGAACGDGACADGEACATCPADCGACPDPCGACGADQACSDGVCVPCLAGPGEADCLYKCPYDPMQWWRGPGARDITFVAFGDPQAVDLADPACMRDAQYADDQMDLTRAAINSVDAHVWPAGAGFYREGAAHDHIRGVVIAGDLTQAGSESFPAGVATCREYTRYRQAFGRCGDEGRLRFPVYDGYGNHDYPGYPSPGDATKHPVLDYLDRITADHRPGAAADHFDDPSPGTGHYAWRWDDVWFVQLNLKVGTADEIVEKSGVSRVMDPQSPRRFLIDFLSSRSDSKSRQIVLITHYGMSSGRFTKAEKQAFCDVLDDARRGQGVFSGVKLAFDWPVIANLHGHTHDAPHATVPNPVDADDVAHWACPNHPDLRIPLFDLGSPFYLDVKNGPGDLHFTVIRIGNEALEAVGVRAPSAAPTGPWTYTHRTRLPHVLAPT